MWESETTVGIVQHVCKVLLEKYNEKQFEVDTVNFKTLIEEHQLKGEFKGVKCCSFDKQYELTSYLEKLNLLKKDAKERTKQDHTFLSKNAHIQGWLRVKLTFELDQSILPTNCIYLSAKELLDRQQAEITSRKGVAYITLPEGECVLTNILDVSLWLGLEANDLAEVGHARPEKRLEARLKPPVKATKTLELPKSDTVSIVTSIYRTARGLIVRDRSDVSLVTHSKVPQYDM